MQQIRVGAWHAVPRQVERSAWHAVPRQVERSVTIASEIGMSRDDRVLSIVAHSIVGDRGLDVDWIMSVIPIDKGTACHAPTRL